MGRWIPLIDTLSAQCLREKCIHNNPYDDNYRDALNKKPFHDAKGRHVLLIHNKNDENNPIWHAENWERALKEKGFAVETHYPDVKVPAEDPDCNGHAILAMSQERKNIAKLVCKFWETTFSVTADCDNVLAFDTNI